MATSIREHRVVKEKLFDRTLPEARWSCSRYAPVPPTAEQANKRNWTLKEKSAKLQA